MELLARPDYMVCSDITPTGSFCHPRCYGAFPALPRALPARIREPEPGTTVERMTDRPARRFGPARRGRIEKGWFADITIFDDQRVMDNATYEDPRQFPTGIPYVIVNGGVAVDQRGLHRASRRTGGTLGRYGNGPLACRPSASRPDSSPTSLRDWQRMRAVRQPARLPGRRLLFAESARAARGSVRRRGSPDRYRRQLGLAGGHGAREAPRDLRHRRPPAAGSRV